MKNKHIGSEFDNFLTENQILEEVTATAHKRIIAMKLVASMQTQHISKIQMAKRMHTSRSSIDRRSAANCRRHRQYV